MRLSPRELDKLVLHQAGAVAQRRLARGLRLNHSEACALIASQIVELIRDGKHSVAQLMDMGRQMLGRRHVLPGVPHTLHEVQVEGTFEDGTKLVTVHSPIAADDADLSLALYGSFLPVPDAAVFPSVMDEDEMAPGAVIVKEGTLELNVGRERRSIKVTNLGDRPVQVGSHYHFIETNKELEFDRAAAYGFRLDIPAGTAVRFEPGDSKVVSLTAIAGSKIISGGNSVAPGPVDPARLPAILEAMLSRGFRHLPLRAPLPVQPPYCINRQRYADAYGPTVGDRVRLGDTELYLEIERDFTHYGDEAVFGGGKVIREGMGQAVGVYEDEALDLVITNAVIVDYTGIYKADIGIKNGLIRGIGKAGNPHVMANVTPGMVIGVTTEVLAAEGHIITAVRRLLPAVKAIASGITTIVGGGTGPNTGTNATTCTPGTAHMKLMLQSTDCIPLNFGFTGKGNTSSPEGLDEQIKAGAIGLKAPDIIRVCGEPNVIPSSTNPTRPFTVNTLDEHLDMLMVCHHLSRDIPEDIAFAESRIRGETIGAEDVLHDLGAISIISSDSQAMGRVGEVVTRTWQTADKMKRSVGQLSPDPNDPEAAAAAGPADNFRIRRYVAKYTINPAITHGMAHMIGSVEVGKLADLVMYKPAFFGTKPEIVMKGGFIAYAQMGDANASIPTPQPVIMRPMFGATGAASAQETSVAFVSQVSLQRTAGGAVQSYGLGKRLVAVAQCRGIGKRNMRLNAALPRIKVDPETYRVEADGVHVTMPPAAKVPLARAAFMF
ncbi:hypothetical protein HK405_015803 [Cladochytrium tenue]|nr:hypothetical protein HK405_015803 [Cladochytrium tenue]